MAELPSLEDVYERELELGVKLLVLEVTGNLSETRKVLEEAEASFPVLLDDSRYSRSELNVIGTPTTFVVDGNGRIRCRLLGAIDDLAELVRKVIHRP